MMPLVRASELIALQRGTANIRNICVLAHVSDIEASVSFRAAFSSFVSMRRWIMARRRCAIA
jgi:hypothetical protein